ncbi:CAP domain [Phytophthora cactorum]|nr:CAP domain [Phytophthora cactorum]
MMAITRSSLALVLMVSAISSDISTAFSNLRTTPRNLQTYSSYDGYFQQMIDAVNAERTKAGLSALCTNKKLAAAAARHSKDMADNDFMEHDGSDGSTMSERITDAGYAWNAVAENVAAGQEDVASVMESWMNSEGHRANILGADYTMFGTAYAYNADSTYKHYWTQDFGAGDTEACDSGSSTASQSTDQTQPQQNEVAGEASTSQDYTTAPSTTAPTTTAPPATTATEAPATEAPATEAPKPTPYTDSPTTETPGCKAKK